MQRRAFSIFAVTFALLASGCADLEPSSAIATKVGPPPLAVSCTGGAENVEVAVDCEGPADQLAALGGLCGFRDRGATSSEEEWMAVAIGPERGPRVLVYGFLPAPQSTADQAKSARYAAFLLQESSTTSSDLFDEWGDGDALTGDLSTAKASREACVTCTFIGGGRLRWGDVTLTLAWGTNTPC